MPELHVLHYLEDFEFFDLADLKPFVAGCFDLGLDRALFLRRFLDTRLGFFSCLRLDWEVLARGFGFDVLLLDPPVDCFFSSSSLSLSSGIPKLVVTTTAPLPKVDLENSSSSSFTCSSALLSGSCCLDSSRFKLFSNSLCSFMSFLISA